MGKIKIIELTKSEQEALEKGFREGKSHSYRMRCKMILLKSQGHTSSEIASLLGCCEVVVNNWLKRYQAEGLKGLEIKPGRGRRPILDNEKDLEKVRVAVTKSRKKLSLAKEKLEEVLGKNFSQKTLERYIKNMVVATKESENVPKKSHMRRSTS